MIGFNPSKVDEIHHYCKAKINKVLAKLGSGALVPAFDETKTIVSDEFCKMSNNKTISTYKLN